MEAHLLDQLSSRSSFNGLRGGRGGNVSQVLLVSLVNTGGDLSSNKPLDRDDGCQIMLRVKSSRDKETCRDSSQPAHTTHNFKYYCDPLEVEVKNCDSFADELFATKFTSQAVVLMIMASWLWNMLL